MQWAVIRENSGLAALLAWPIWTVNECVLTRSAAELNLILCAAVHAVCARPPRPSMLFAAHLFTLPDMLKELRASPRSSSRNAIGVLEASDFESVGLILSNQPTW